VSALGERSSKKENKGKGYIDLCHSKVKEKLGNPILKGVRRQKTLFRRGRGLGVESARAFSKREATSSITRTK